MPRHVNLTVLRNGTKHNVYTVDAENKGKCDAICQAFVTKEIIDAYNVGYDLSKLDFNYREVEIEEVKKQDTENDSVNLFDNKNKKGKKQEKDS